MFWGLVIWYSIKVNSLPQKLFKNEIFVFLGKISYGIYIFHWPIFRLLKGELVSSGLPGILSTSSIATAISISMATFRYFSYEKYFFAVKKVFLMITLICFI
jgi:peptidoglycan/LPS O-acetylase OafA/YrhL